MVAMFAAACSDRALPTAVPPVPAGPRLNGSSATELFISEMIEGSSNNKAIEIYNGTGAPVSLSGYSIAMYFNGNPASTLNIPLTSTASIPAGGVFVLAQGSANAAILALANQTNGSGWFNGDDAIALRKNGVNIDVIGQIGFDPGTEWGALLVSTADNTLRRQSMVCAGDANGADVFDPAVQWDGFAVDNIVNLGQHTAACGTVTLTPPVVSATVPANNATGVQAGANILVTFSAPVSATGSWYAISCSVTGAHPAIATADAANTTFTLNPDTDFSAGELCSVTITATQIALVADATITMAADVSLSFTIDSTLSCVGPIPTRIYSVQGSGLTSPLVGTVVSTEGVIVGDYEGTGSLDGFYLQDATGDADPATSDGIFVFTPGASAVSVGQRVRVRGTVSETFGQTQIGTVTSVLSCGTASLVPAPVDITLPLATATTLEQYEGMLVRFPQRLYVTEHFQLGRFGEVVVSSGARLSQPTNVTTPGAAAVALQAANDRNRIILDDAAGIQNADPIVFGRGGNPLSASNTLRGGDYAENIIGVLGFGFSNYRVQPLNSLGGGVPNFIAANPRPTPPVNVGGTMKVAVLNLLNYYNTFGSSACRNGLTGSTNQDCRGADNTTEFNRQWAKTVAAVTEMDADVVGLVELENDGYGASSAIADLVSRLNTAVGTGTYAFLDVDAATGQVDALGTDGIKVGVIYKPARVQPVGATGALNSVAFVNGGDGSPRNRPALAQGFVQLSTGGRFIAVINHFKSKGSACSAADAGDGQGNCNAVRVQAANELRNWLASNPTGVVDTDVLILGDLNSYAKEDPITALTGAGGFIDLVNARIGALAYSFVFGGQWGYLDYALASSSMNAQVTGVTEWHINADEPLALDYNTEFKSAGQVASLYAADRYRVSDHDPIVLGLALNSAPLLSITPPASWTAGQPGNLGVLFSSTRGAPFTVRIDWGDNTPMTQYVSTIAPRTPINRPHTYAAGSYVIMVSVTDRSGVTTKQNLRITVP